MARTRTRAVAPVKAPPPDPRSSEERVIDTGMESLIRIYTLHREFDFVNVLMQVHGKVLTDRDTVVGEVVDEH